MIDKNNGYLVISEKVQLKPNDPFDLIKEFKLGESQDLRDHENGYKWLTVKNLKVNDEYFILALCFQDNSLRQFNLVVNEEAFPASSSWNDWDEQVEKNKLIRYKAWIKAHLGYEGTFSWGQINASYDSKGGASTISVRYN
jgi:hypothetical protein